jgi:hypothetical protein
LPKELAQLVRIIDEHIIDKATVEKGFKTGDIDTAQEKLKSFSSGLRLEFTEAFCHSLAIFDGSTLEEARKKAESKNKPKAEQTPQISIEERAAALNKASPTITPKDLLPAVAEGATSHGVVGDYIEKNRGPLEHVRKVLDLIAEMKTGEAQQNAASNSLARKPRLTSFVKRITWPEKFSKLDDALAKHQQIRKAESLSRRAETASSEIAQGMKTMDLFKESLMGADENAANEISTLPFALADAALVCAEVHHALIQQSPRPQEAVELLKKTHEAIVKSLLPVFRDNTTLFSEFMVTLMRDNADRLAAFRQLENAGLEMLHENARQAPGQRGSNGRVTREDGATAAVPPSSREAAR